MSAFPSALLVVGRPFRGDSSSPAFRLGAMRSTLGGRCWYTEDGQLVALPDHHDLSSLCRISVGCGGLPEQT